MLLEYGFRNFFSFREGAQVSFRLDGNTPDEIRQGREVSTILGVMGANASGKTQLLKALIFLSQFATHSFFYKPEALISFEAFYQSKEDSEFYAEFQVDGIEFRYELELTDARISRESLFRTKAKRTLILERRLNVLTHATKEFDSLNKIILRSNASIISTAHQYGITCLDDFYKFFLFIRGNANYLGRTENPNLVEIAELLHKDLDAKNFVETLLRECDLGLAGLSIYETEAKDGAREYQLYFDHILDGHIKKVPSIHESSGTKTLVCILPSFYSTLKYGGVLALDELDIHLHPHILPKLAAFFSNPECNPLGAQLITTTHDHDLLDLLGRYRIYLTNKRDNESFAYRLDEIQGDVLRNDRSLRTPYDAGKIGGVPRL